MGKDNRKERWDQPLPRMALVHERILTQLRLTSIKIVFATFSPFLNKRGVKVGLVEDTKQNTSSRQWKDMGHQLSRGWLQQKGIKLTRGAITDWTTVINRQGNATNQTNHINEPIRTCIVHKNVIWCLYVQFHAGKAHGWYVRSTRSGVTQRAVFAASHFLLDRDFVQTSFYKQSGDIRVLFLELFSSRLMNSTLELAPSRFCRFWSSK